MSQRLLTSDPNAPGTGAEFSTCRTWRYSLWRIWDWQGFANCVAFIGLNPSTADENIDDPTIRRCIDFAKRWGYGGLYMLNLFAFRATDPAVMKAAPDPIGPENDRQLAYYQSNVGRVVAAWGKHGSHANRAAAIRKILRGPLHCLGVNNDGSPKHPLYVKGDTVPSIWNN
jgi:hypothetical protein